MVNLVLCPTSLCCSSYSIHKHGVQQQMACPLLLWCGQDGCCYARLQMVSVGLLQVMIDLLHEQDPLGAAIWWLRCCEAETVCNSAPTLHALSLTVADLPVAPPAAAPAPLLSMLHITLRHSQLYCKPFSALAQSRSQRLCRHDPRSRRCRTKRSTLQ